MKSISIKDFSNYICVGGVRRVSANNIKSIMNHIKEIKSAEIQLFNAKNISSFDHLIISTINALNAFKSNSRISNSTMTETMLFASTQNQVSKSLEILGTKDDSDEIALIVLSKDPMDAEKIYHQISELIGIEDDSVLNLTHEKKKNLIEVFKITDLEIQSANDSDSLSKLIIEKGALLRLKRN